MPRARVQRVISGHAMAPMGKNPLPTLVCAARTWLLSACLLDALALAGCKSRPANEISQAAPTQSVPPGIEQTLAASASQPASDPAHPEDGHEHDMPPAECPVKADDSHDPGALLDQASQSYADSDFAVAYECASAAADLVPRSVDAHHMRAAAAAALGRHELARTAFTMALALDPDDPETLAATADFYINILPPKRRDALLIGLEHARRGRARAVVRRRTGRELRARLALLEAQAYNDLGQPDEALERVDEVLELMPDWVEAKHERGVALFNACKFHEAGDAFVEVLGQTGEDAYAHHHLGLIYERLGRLSESETHFRRARELAPEEFWPPVLLTPEEFRAEVHEALSELPAEVGILLDDVAVEVMDYPALADLTAVTPPFPPTILGLYRGLPLGVEARDVAGDTTEPIPPRAIVLYRKNLARAVKTRDELDRQIRRTLLHEIGHLTGLDEDTLRRRGLD